MPSLLITVGVILILLSINNVSVVAMSCYSGVLSHEVTCEFPQVVEVVNRVRGAVLASINNGPFTQLGNTTVYAEVISYKPYVYPGGTVKFSNTTVVQFSIDHPLGYWLNFTLPGTCDLSINATLQGGGYFYILVISNGSTIGFTPYTYSYYTTTHAVGSLDVLIKPAIPLACPCVVSLVTVNITGECTPNPQVGYAYLDSVAYVRYQGVNWDLLYTGVALTLASIPLLLTWRKN